MANTTTTRPSWLTSFLEACGREREAQLRGALAVNRPGDLLPQVPARPLERFERGDRVGPRFRGHDDPEARGARGRHDGFDDQIEQTRVTATGEREAECLGHLPAELPGLRVVVGRRNVAVIGDAHGDV